MIPVRYALDSIGGSDSDIASIRLDGKRKFKSTGLARMFAGLVRLLCRMFVTSDVVYAFLLFCA